MQPTWVSKCGRVVLYRADCLSVLPTLAAGSVDAVVTDPPYANGRFFGVAITSTCRHAELSWCGTKSNLGRTFLRSNSRGRTLNAQQDCFEKAFVVLCLAGFTLRKNRYR